MDPDECLNVLLERISLGEWSDAADLAASLQHWLQRGGFPPGGGRLRQTSLDAFLSWVISYANREADSLSKKGE